MSQNQQKQNQQSQNQQSPNAAVSDQLMTSESLEEAFKFLDAAIARAGQNRLFDPLVTWDSISPSLQPPKTGVSSQLPTKIQVKAGPTPNSITCNLTVPAVVEWVEIDFVIGRCRRTIDDDWNVSRWVDDES